MCLPSLWETQCNRIRGVHGLYTSGDVSLAVLAPRSDIDAEEITSKM